MAERRRWGAGEQNGLSEAGEVLEIVHTVGARRVQHKDFVKPLVLVVEDEPEAASLIEDILVRGGCSVLVAHAGEHALELVRELPRPDMVLIDLELPVMDGRTFIRTMRADPTLSGIPIVVVSSAADAAKVYATDNVRKCLLLDGLRRVLDRLHQQPETVRESA